MDQTQTQRYVPRFKPLALRPRLHREGFPIHQGVPNSSLNLTNATRQYKHNPPRKEGQALSQTTTITSTEEGYKPTLTPPHQEGVNQQSQPLPKREQITTPINLYQRGIQQNKEGTTSGVSQPQTKSFSHKINDPIEQDRVIQLKCGKPRVWKLKTQRKTLGKTLDKIDN